MKGNVKKLVLALGVGLVLGGAAMAQNEVDNKNQIVTVVSANNGNYKSIDGVTDSAIKICQMVAAIDTKAYAGNGYVDATDARTILETNISDALKEKYPGATKQGRLQCDFYFTSLSSHLASHSKQIDHISIVR